MIFNMVGGGAGGAGGGATLVVSSPANVSVTVSKDDKSYTKNSGSLGSATFKGLATGTWTVTISGNGQTATKTIEITADYAITIAFFSASINITYPATSTCVVTNSNGQTVASDTNTGSTTKTWTATVNATGTYTVTATATDGSGKSKSQSVSITADGQSESVTLSYIYYLFKENDIAQNKMTYKQRSETATSVTVSDEFIQVTRPSGSTNFGEVQFYSEDKHDLSMYDTLYFDVSIQDVYVFEGNTTRCGVFSTEPTTSDPGTVVAVTVIESSNDRKTYTVDLTAITKSWPLYVGLGGNFVGKIYNIWAE